MTEGLPPNVYRVAQHRFDAVPRSPWVYWLPERVRQIFETERVTEDTHHTCRGIQTSDNTRFIRYWWEMGLGRVSRHKDNSFADTVWFPYMKGGTYREWYGNQDHILNWGNNGEQLYAFRPRSVIRNARLMLSEGVTFSTITSGRIGYRYMPEGFFWDQAGSALIPKAGSAVVHLAILNSTLSAYLTKLVAPTINYTIGDVGRVPFCTPNAEATSELKKLSTLCIWLSLSLERRAETSWDFVVPSSCSVGLSDLAVIQTRMTALESQIDDEVYRLYSISDEYRAAIEAELAGEPLIGEEDEDAEPTGDEEEDTEPPMTAEELAVRWISYAVGIVLGRFRPGRFQPGLPPRVGGDERGGLGSAVYRREGFAVGSLPAPDEAEFDQLVGPAERFAYVDADGGRHVFPAEVETALRDLALPDGIAVLDEGHERDLPALVERALTLMLDVKRENARREEGNHALRFTHHAAQVIETGAGGDLRRFFERNFFTWCHFRWYRKRPVYWPLQSARRSYGFVVFHERVDRSTLYVLQRDYLDHKLNGLRLQIGDLRGQAEALSGAARKRVERQIDQAAQLLDELTEFAQTMERIVREGYEPGPDWIDDGVILRLAPLWELIPIWWREPKKYWERLEQGDYDWSHIAKRYWPERVREKCKENKSYAIAHGHEEWYERT